MPPVLFPFPLGPANPGYDVLGDHTFTGFAPPSEGPCTEVLVESGRAPGGVGVKVDMGGCVSPEVGEVVECVCDCWGAAFSAGMYIPPSSVLPSGESVCRRSLARSVPAP